MTRGTDEQGEAGDFGEKGWKVGTAEEFLGLSPEESRCIDRRLAFSKTGSGHTLGTVE